MRLLVALIVLALLSTDVQAQNALGDGRALDNNPSATGRRTNRPARDFQAEMRFRNAITTGNAPGGLSFRGDLGYTAPGEFRGDLGSTDLFAFRRDSYTSGLAGMGIRGTESLQFQFALTTGGRPPSNLVGSYTVPRSFDTTAGFAPGTTRPMNTSVNNGMETPGLARPGPHSEFADDRGTMLSTLRSPSAYVANASSVPSVLANVTSSETGEQSVFTASSLQGLRLTPIAINTRIAPPGSPETPVEEEVTAHDQVLERLRGMPGVEEEDAEDVDTRPAYQRRLDELRQQLFGLVETEEANAITIDDRVRELIAGPAMPIDSLSGNVIGSPTAYSAHMRSGEGLIARGRYFDAEERFTRALAAKPTDVTAQVGRVHAQLGAGLFLSASLNLRGMLSARPEMIGVRYDASLLPTGERLADIIELLEEATQPYDPAKAGEGGATTSRKIRREAGLLLAYLGYQTGSPERVAEGLTSWRGSLVDPEDIDHRLIGLLEAAWSTPSGP